jgi:3-dehydroquinate dehydratase-2
MKVAIINGPNLNLLGTRNPEIYGRLTLEAILSDIRNRFPETEVVHFQSNVESDLIQAVQDLAKTCQGLVLNAGGFTHTSVALADAVEAVAVPVVEVHLSQIAAREPFRQKSLLAPVVQGSISGFGALGYTLAISSLLSGSTQI